MKILYLTEGQNDIIFLEKILVVPSFYSADKISTCKLNGVKHVKRTAETSAISKFMEPSSPYLVLIKEEKGKQSLLQLFSSICINVNIYNSKSLKIVTILDHDSVTPESEFKALRQRIKSSKPGIDFVQSSCTDHNGIAHSSVYNLIKLNHPSPKLISTAFFFCFYSSLEEAANKLNPGLNQTERIKKLAKLFRAEDIFAL